MMRHPLILLFFVCYTSVVYSQDSLGYKQNEMDYTKINMLFEQSQVLGKNFHGFSLYDLDENKFVFGINETKYFTPASNTKVFTLFASLKHIGDSIPGLAYVIRGDSLIFWGTGDPSFLYGKLDSKKVLNFLSNSPYQLYYAPAKNVEASYRPGWTVEDYQYAFQPDISTFPIYGNIVHFYRGSKHINTYPSYFEKSLKLKSKSGTFRITRSFHDNIFEQSSTAIPKNFSSYKPFVYSNDLFVFLLQDVLKKNITAIDYDIPDDVQILYSISTNEVLREMMLHSDNFLAEHLYYVASFVKYKKFDSELIRKEMQDDYYIVFEDRVKLEDGSGLSTYNKVTPRSMIELLLMIKLHVADEANLLTYFPAGKVSGTLKNSYSLINGHPFVWAKTGTISGVYCQSGYFHTKGGKKYAFSFLNNNIFGSALRVRQEMVRIITHIHQNY